MDKCTHDVRTAHWKNIVQQCQQRPTGLSVQKWLDENNILSQSYYYWQRKFRQETYAQINDSSLSSVPDTSNAISFVEISAPVHQETTTMKSSLDTIKPAAIIKTATMSIAISNDISEQLLSRIIQEVDHA